METLEKRSAQMSDSLLIAVIVALSGGFQDAYTYFCRDGVFANAQTGNIVLMSSSFFRGDFMRCLKYIFPIVAFFLGTFIAESVRHKCRSVKSLHWRQIIIIAEIVLLFSVGFMPVSLTLIANVIVSFVCAMQVQTFHKVRGHVYASTMCIGNLRSGSEALSHFFRTREKKYLHTFGTYLTVIFAFAVGAGIGSLLSSLLGLRAIWCCCALLFAGFCIMFRHP